MQQQKKNKSFGRLADLQPMKDESSQQELMSRRLASIYSDSGDIMYHVVDPMHHCYFWPYCRNIDYHGEYHTAH